MWPYLVAAVIVLASVWVWQRKRALGVLKRIGIDGPTPGFIYGNMKKLKEPRVRFMKWEEKYGKTFGIYIGSSPQIVTSDLDFIQQVFVKQFSSFHRRAIPESVETDGEETPLLFAKGQRWKRLRMISNPSFSSLKMKQMAPLMQESINGLVKNLEKRCQDGKPFDIQREFQGLTMEVIGSCGFGLDINSVRDQTSPFLAACRKVFSRSLVQAGPMMLASLFPLFTYPAKIWNKYLTRFISRDLYKLVDATISARMSDSEHRRVDMLQLMLDAKADNSDSDAQKGGNANDTVLESDEKEDMQNGLVSDQRKMSKAYLTLTEKEIRAQCAVFLLAGYETTSTTLAYAAYELAGNPEAQRTLQEEIDKHTDGDGPPSYESIQKMPYLEMCLMETMRIHTITPLGPGRTAEEPCNVLGFHIPAGMRVRTNTYCVHMDPEQWGPPDPSEFCPERFTPERKAKRHPMAYQAFGLGPRQCVGMRFALMEAKMALVCFLKNFNVETCSETQIPMKYKIRGTRQPENGVIVRITKRK